MLPLLFLTSLVLGSYSPDKLTQSSCRVHQVWVGQLPLPALWVDSLAASSRHCGCSWSLWTHEKTSNESSSGIVCRDGECMNDGYGYLDDRLPSLGPLAPGRLGARLDAVGARLDAQADIMRIAVLYAFGGTYFDVDMALATEPKDDRHCLALRDLLHYNAMRSVTAVRTGPASDDEGLAWLDGSTNRSMLSVPRAEATFVREFHGTDRLLANSVIAAAPYSQVLAAIAAAQDKAIAALTADDRALLAREDAADYRPREASIDSVEVTGPSVVTAAVAQLCNVAQPPSACAKSATLTPNLFFSSHWGHVDDFPLTVADLRGRGAVDPTSLTVQFGYSTNGYWRTVDFGAVRRLADLPSMSLLAEAVTIDDAVRAVAQARAQSYPQALLQLVLGVRVADDDECALARKATTANEPTEGALLTLSLRCFLPADMGDAALRFDTLRSDATGDVLVHWRADAQVVHAPRRLLAQAMPLVRDEAELVALGQAERTIVDVSGDRVVAAQPFDQTERTAAGRMPKTQPLSEAVASSLDFGSLAYTRQLSATVGDLGGTDESLRTQRNAWLVRAATQHGGLVSVLPEVGLEARATGVQAVEHEDVDRVLSKRNVTASTTATTAPTPASTTQAAPPPASTTQPFAPTTSGNPGAAGIGQDGSGNDGGGGGGGGGGSGTTIAIVAAAIIALVVLVICVARSRRRVDAVPVSGIVTMTTLGEQPSGGGAQGRRSSRGSRRNSMHGRKMATYADVPRGNNGMVPNQGYPQQGMGGVGTGYQHPPNPQGGFAYPQQGGGSVYGAAPAAGSMHARPQDNVYSAAGAARTSEQSGGVYAPAGSAGAATTGMYAPATIAANGAPGNYGNVNSASSTYDAVSVSGGSYGNLKLSPQNAQY